MAGFDTKLAVETVVSGKLRRYHHLTLMQHLLIPSVLLPNIRDFFLVGVGVLQSIIKLLLWRPDVVFTKGGYVCLPVGWAAYLLRIPLIIHDSDAHPGLTNRLLARAATVIATGAPLEYYKYPKAKSVYVGVPVGSMFRPFSSKQQRQGKQSLGVDEARPLIVVTGGGLGARRINDSVAFHLKALLQLGSVILVSGTDQYDELRAITPQDDPRFQLHAFVSDAMATMLGSADVVISRAGQTTILELAALAKPTILVPNGRLTGGHQLKNAKVYADKHAVIVVDDEGLEDSANDSLVRAVKQLLANDVARGDLARAIHQFAKPLAAKDMADIIVKTARG